MTTDPDRPIGVFDSGVGGLTVLKAIRERLPHEHLVYLGDTARLPYGTKSPASVRRYAARATSHLCEHGVKLLVVACNTASAVALGDLRRALEPLPIVGVVEPGARAAVEARAAAHHLVLATEATVRLGAYSAAIATLDAEARVTELPCEMLVALAEEGWTEGAVAEAIIMRYLEPYLDESEALRHESIILGCTHFPILKRAIRRVVGGAVSIVDSAGTTAEAVARELELRGLLREQPADTTLRLLATDGAGRFARVGGAFLGAGLTAGDIELVDL